MRRKGRGNEAICSWQFAICSWHRATADCELPLADCLFLIRHPATHKKAVNAFIFKSITYSYSK